MPKRRENDWALTKRELKTLEWLRKGLAAKEIAAKMHITLITVKFHITNIYRKFGVAGRLALHQKIGFHE